VAYALELRIPWIPYHNWPYVLLGMFCMRTCNAGNFFVGVLWQLFWTSNHIFFSEILHEKQSICHDFFWFLCENSQDLTVVLDMAYLPVFSYDLRSRIYTFYEAWDPVWGNWFLQFSFGKVIENEQEWRSIYKSLGLLHILVVSGSHFTLIGGFLKVAIELPVRLSYSAGLINYRAWINWNYFSRLIVCFLMSEYAFLVGFNPPCQRAWLSLILHLIGPMILGPLSLRQHDRIVLFFQSLLFSNSFLSMSNALSWCSYGILRRTRLWPKVWQRWLLPGLELPLLSVTVSFFGFFSPIGVILNPILQPFWQLALIVGILFFFWPENFLGEVLRYGLSIVHSILIYSYLTQLELGGVIGYSKVDLLWNLLRCVLWFAATWVLVDIWRNDPKLAETSDLP